MITRVYVSNYRSLGPGLDLELGAITALVGPNGSGKSNIADVLRFLAECATTSLSQAVALRHGAPALRRWSDSGPLDVKLGVVVSNAHGYGFWLIHLGPAAEEAEFRVRYESAAWWPRSAWTRNVMAGLKESFAPEATDTEIFFDRLQGKPKGFSRKERGTRATLAYRGIAPVAVNATRLLLPMLAESPLSHLTDELRRLAVYALLPSRLREPQKSGPTKLMTSSGDNWPAALRALDRDGSREALLGVLSRLTGDIDDFRVAQTGGFLIPEFRHGAGPSGRERWHVAAQEADGALRVAAMITALLQHPPLSLVGFEEPELGIHPGALPIVLGFLKEMSARSQILLTTHSAELVDLLSIDDVRAVELRDGVTTASRVDERQRELVRRRVVSASHLLRTEGLHPAGGAEQVGGRLDDA